MWREFTIFRYGKRTKSNALSLNVAVAIAERVILLRILLPCSQERVRCWTHTLTLPKQLGLKATIVVWACTLPDLSLATRPLLTLALRTPKGPKWNCLPQKKIQVTWLP